MWSRCYREHVIMAFPSFDTATNLSAAQADISWPSGPVRESEFVRFPTRVLAKLKSFVRAQSQQVLDRSTPAAHASRGAQRTRTYFGAGRGVARPCVADTFKRASANSFGAGEGADQYFYF